MKGFFPHDLEEVMFFEMTDLDCRVFTGEYGDIDSSDICECAQNGYIELFSVLLEYVPIWKDFLCLFVCEASGSGQWDFVMDILDNYSHTCLHCVQKACVDGYQPFLEYILLNFKSLEFKDNWDSEILELLQVHGHLDVFIWAVTVAKYPIHRDFLERASLNSDTRILEWYYHGGYIDPIMLKTLHDYQYCIPQVRTLLEKWIIESELL